MVTMLHITSLELLYFVTGSVSLLHTPPVLICLPNPLGSLERSVEFLLLSSGPLSSFSAPSTPAPRMNKCHRETEVACKMLGLPQRPLLSRILSPHVLAAQAALSPPQTLTLLYYIQLFWLFSVGVLVCYNLLHHSPKLSFQK